MKADYAIFDDGNEDVAWDGVWDVATRIDSLGWTAEYRIPLSQLHYSAKGECHLRLPDLARRSSAHGESVTWPLYRPSRSGFTSQFGELTGLQGLASPGTRRSHPTLLTKNVQGPASDGYPRDQELTVGGDLKYRLASNLTLNATVNPDFGQVEADPSVLNLSAFETFFQERRPFFVEGKGLFTFQVNCVVVVDCQTGEGLFYSRRIGRSPQLAGVYGDESSADATRILGAAKITGRMPGGFSLGMLDAVTDDVRRPSGTLEPTTNYAVARGNQDFAGGDGSVGFIVTAVNRSLDETQRALAPSQRVHAAARCAASLRRQQYEVSGSLDWSRVAGTPEAITRTQRNTVHLYQRPDGAAGVRLQPHLARREPISSFGSPRWAGGGCSSRPPTSGARRGSRSTTSASCGRPTSRCGPPGPISPSAIPTAIFRELRWNFNNWQHWSLDGLPTERAFNTNVHTQLNNRWWLHAGGTIGQLGATYCDRCARGGPAIRQTRTSRPGSASKATTASPWSRTFWLNYMRGDGGGPDAQPGADAGAQGLHPLHHLARREWERNRDDIQYFGTFTDSTGAEHYTFAHLEQETLSFTWRPGTPSPPTRRSRCTPRPSSPRAPTATSARSAYAAREAVYDARYRPYDDPEVAGDPGGFNVQQFRSNVVFRWEYRPGSTLFLVWSQGRQGEEAIEGRNRSAATSPTSSASAGEHVPGEGVLLVRSVAGILVTLTPSEVRGKGTMLAMVSFTPFRVTPGPSWTAPAAGSSPPPAGTAGRPRARLPQYWMGRVAADYAGDGPLECSGEPGALPRTAEANLCRDGKRGDALASPGRVRQHLAELPLHLGREGDEVLGAEPVLHPVGLGAHRAKTSGATT